MRKMIYTACAALLITVASAPTAHADGHDSKDGVGLSVRGSKLYVKVAAGSVGGHTRARAQLYTYTPGNHDHTDLTRWKRGRHVTAAHTKITVYKWKLNRSFPNNKRICMRVEDRNGIPCVIIHR